MWIEDFPLKCERVDGLDGFPTEAKKTLSLSPAWNFKDKLFENVVCYRQLCGSSLELRTDIGLLICAAEYFIATVQRLIQNALGRIKAGFLY